MLELAERLGHARHSDTAALRPIADATGDTPHALPELYQVLVVEHMSRAIDTMAQPTRQSNTEVSSR